MNDSIPHKQVEKEQKHCVLCKQFGGSPNTHNTNECNNKYEKDSSHKHNKGGRKGSRGEANIVTKSEKAWFAQFMKDNNKSMKISTKKIARKCKHK